MILILSDLQTRPPDVLVFKAHRLPILLDEQNYGRTLPPALQAPRDRLLTRRGGGRRAARNCDFDLIIISLISMSFFFSAILLLLFLITFIIISKTSSLGLVRGWRHDFTSLVRAGPRLAPPPRPPPRLLVPALALPVGVDVGCMTAAEVSATRFPCPSPSSSSSSLTGMLMTALMRRTTRG